MTDLPRKPKKTGTASRFLFTGAALGASLAAVGVMSAAAQVDEPAPAATPGVQRVVIPQPVSPVQVTVPQRATVPAQTDAPEQVTTPPAPPVPQPPVTQSGGS